MASIVKPSEQNHNPDPVTFNPSNLSPACLIDVSLQITGNQPVDVVGTLEMVNPNFYCFSTNNHVLGFSDNGKSTNDTIHVDFTIKKLVASTANIPDVLIRVTTRDKLATAKADERVTRVSFHV